MVVEASAICLRIESPHSHGDAMENHESVLTIMERQAEF